MTLKIINVKQDKINNSENIPEMMISGVDRDESDFSDRSTVFLMMLFKRFFSGVLISL